MPGGKAGGGVPKEAKELLKWFSTQVRGYEPVVGEEQRFVDEMMPEYIRYAKASLAAQPLGFDYAAYDRAMNMANKAARASTSQMIGNLKRLGLATSGEAVGLGQASEEALGGARVNLANQLASVAPQQLLRQAELAGNLSTPRLLQILSGVAGTGGQLGIGIGQIRQQEQAALWNALAQLGKGLGPFL